MKLNITINQKYAVYVDLTTNLVPFYVGLGNQDRIRQIKRNRKHGGVAKKYGLIRVVVFETDNSEIVKQKEIEVIADCQTFFYDHQDNPFACNFTRGGDGLCGKPHTQKTKLKQSKSALGNVRGKANKGNFHTLETKAKIAAKKKGIRTPAGERVVHEFEQIIARMQNGESKRKIAKDYSDLHPKYFERLIADLQVSLLCP